MRSYFNLFFYLAILFGATCCNKRFKFEDTYTIITQDESSLDSDSCIQESCDIIVSKLSTREVRRLEKNLFLYPVIVSDSQCIGMYRCTLSSPYSDFAVNAFVLFGKQGNMILQTQNRWINRRQLSSYLKAHSTYFSDPQILEMELRFGRQKRHSIQKSTHEYMIFD